jgi:hypothetical protein
MPAPQALRESLGSALTSEKTQADDKAKTAQVALLYTESLTDVLGSGRKGTAKGTKIGLMGDEEKNEFSKAGRMSASRAGIRLGGVDQLRRSPIIQPTQRPPEARRKGSLCSPAPETA